MNRAPLCGIAISFILGIAIARYANIPFIIFWAASLSALIASIIFLKSKAGFPLFLSISILFLGGAAFRNSEILPPDHLSNFTASKGVPVYLEGVVDSDPIAKSRFSTFVFKAQKLSRAGLTPPYIDVSRYISVSGKCLVKVFKKDAFIYGDRLLLGGTLYRPPYFRISKRLNYRDYLIRQDIRSVFNVGKDSFVKILEKRKGNPLKRLALSMRRRAKTIITDNMPPFSADILSAVILGERSNLSKDIRDIMVQSGTVHIIAISGLHVGLISLVILMALKILRIPARPRYVIAALFLIVYCLLTGARTPAVRVTIMALVFFFGYIIGREKDVYNALSLAALVILIRNPNQLFDVSFQLSFISIISIAALTPKIGNIFPERFSATTFRRRLIALFSGSSAAWMGLFPLIAYYFNIISPVAVLANMFVVPYLLIVVGSGVLAVLAGFIYPPLAPVFFAASEGSIILLVKLISLAARIPGAYFYLPDISPSFVGSCYLFIIAIFLIRGRKN